MRMDARSRISGQLPQATQLPSRTKLLLASVAAIGTFVVAPSAANASATSCTSQLLQAVAPPELKIKDIPNLAPVPGLPATKNGVAHIPAAGAGGDAQEYCLVTGSIVTNPKTGKTANFAAILPAADNWNRKFLFQGCGYHCGVVYRSSFGEAKRGYSVWATDDGHMAGPSPNPERLDPSTDSKWATLAPGKPNTDAVEDFKQRAVAEVARVGKEFTRKFYEADKVARAYMIGCSDGGREGMVALNYYPSMFDGIIAGAPYFDMDQEMYVTYVGVLAQLRSPGAQLTPALFELLDRAVKERCDPADGTADGLVQSPERCNFDPYTDLPQCKPGSSGRDCFTREQIDTVSVISSAIVNPKGQVVYPGYSLTDAQRNLQQWLGFAGAPSNRSGPDPWAANPAEQPLGWYWSQGAIRHLIYQDAPGFNPVTTPGITFRRNASGHLQAAIPQVTVDRAERMTKRGSGATPSGAAEFLREGRKLIMYHGYSDGLITPYRTVQYYRELARRNGGYAKLQNNAVLFMAGNVDHCYFGTGPSTFGQHDKPLTDPHPTDARNDILVALERWVEHGEKPRQLIATKYEDDKPGRPVRRTIPLCPYPAMARYNGSGDVNAAQNWSCRAGDERMLELGSAGKRAGVAAPLLTSDIAQASQSPTGR